MQYLIGAVGALLVLGGLGAAFLLGVRFGRRSKANGPMRASGPTRDEAAADAMDETAKRREEQLKRDFEIISGYNLNKALERRKA